MAEDIFDLLIKVRDMAETANGNAQKILNDYRRRPDFSYAATSRSPIERRAQERAAARKRLIIQHHHVDRLLIYQHGFPPETFAALDLIRRTTALHVPTIYVGGLSYPNAHEAAHALADDVQHAWQSCGGYDAVERAPDRLHARSEDDDADIAIEVSIDIYKNIRKLRKKGLPTDLYGQIQQEFEAAWNLAEQDAVITFGDGKATPARTANKKLPGSPRFRSKDYPCPKCKSSNVRTESSPKDKRKMKCDDCGRYYELKK